jgi:predicted enzyme related to lactoylglutathione lyase
MAIDFAEAWAAIGAEEFAATVDFYSALFGREPDSRIRDIYVEFRLPQLRLGIFRPRQGHEAEFRNSPEKSSGLNLVLRVKDLDLALSQWTHLGAPPPDKITPITGGREAYAYDPCGNRILLVEMNSSESEKSTP